MKLYTTNSTSAISKYLLLDNDFLDELFRDNEMLKEFLVTFKDNYLLIDPLTEFEFLRDVFEPRHRRLKKAFLAQPFFLPIPNRQKIFMKLSENAMILSLIYSHKGHNKNTKISLIDLFLGARSMFNAGSIMIITGNKKDFPNSIYDIVSIINIEKNDGTLKPYSILKFNSSKFNDCYKAIQKIEERYNKSLDEIKI